MPAASVVAAMATALTFRSLNASGHARTAPIGPPVAVAAPRNGSVWMRMMMTPMPDMKPDITEYGV